MIKKNQTPWSKVLRELLFNNTLDGLAYCQIIFNKQRHIVDFIFVDVNKNFDKLTGLKEVKGKKVTELIPGILLYNPELFEICGKAALTGKTEKFEIYIKPLLSWFLVSVNSPKKEFFVAIFQNTTERKRLDEDLKNAKIAAQNVYEDLLVEKESLARAKAKDEALLQSLGEGVVAVDKEGKVIVVNEMAENFLGFTASELIGKQFIHMVSLEDMQGKIVPDLERPLMLAITLGKTTITTTTTAYYFIRKDGTKFPAAINVTPMMLVGEIVGAINVFSDITKEKEIEKLRIDFLSLASHQLRTPLSGTKWLIETIQNGVIGKLNPKQKEYLSNLYKVNERMIKLVSDMLNVLMMESGVVAVKKEEVSVFKIYEELLLMMEPAARTKGIILVNPIQKSRKLFVIADFQALRSILENFISNAINYSQNGQIVVLDAKEESEMIVFSVKDCGIGIPKKEQQRMFERFYRASNAIIFKPDGAGLGLYTSSLLAQKVGGKISFESAENKGTTFYLRMPKKSTLAETLLLTKSN